MCKSDSVIRQRQSSQQQRDYYYGKEGKKAKGEPSNDDNKRRRTSLVVITSVRRLWRVDTCVCLNTQKRKKTGSRIGACLLYALARWRMEEEKKETDGLVCCYWAPNK